MGIPILTSEGFVGQRWIIDDYFQAGETLHAGDVVVVRQRATSPFLPRVFKATSHKQRVIGIVHTPASKQVGDKVAGTGTTVCPRRLCACCGPRDSESPFQGQHGSGRPRGPLWEYGNWPCDRRRYRQRGDSGGDWSHH